MKTGVSLFLVILAVSVLLAPSGGSDEVNKDLTMQISDILTECKKITAGKTRADLLKVFTTEGGLSTAARRTFAHRRCPYIKVDVDFSLANGKQSVEQPTDIVSKISNFIWNGVLAIESDAWSGAQISALAVTVKTLLLSFLSGSLLFTTASIEAAAPATKSEQAINSIQRITSSIPYVPTRHDTVKDLLWLADVGTNDVVYDLGSGDGRVVIAAVRDFGARRAVGIEINPQLVRESRENAARAGVTNRVEFFEGDLFMNDFSEASVVVLYLGHGVNVDLRAKIVRTLRPGSRVVSHQFGMGEWRVDKMLDVRTTLLGMYGETVNRFSTNSEVPDFNSVPSRRDHDTVSMWVVPTPIAGVWRGKVRLGSGDAGLKMSLHQRLSQVSGAFELTGTTNVSGGMQVDLWGTHVRASFLGITPANHLTLFDGNVNGDVMKGSLWISDKSGTREMEWIAQRDKADFTGNWICAAPSNSAVQIKIERREGRLAATYLDPNRTPPYRGTNQPIQVSDIYDFGGGFYFTLLLGREGAGRRMGAEDGWVVGEAIEASGSLTGTIAFYPYPEWRGDRLSPFSRALNSAPKEARRPFDGEGRLEWSAKRAPN